MFSSGGEEPTSGSDGASRSALFTSPGAFNMTFFGDRDLDLSPNFPIDLIRANLLSLYFQLKKNTVTVGKTHWKDAFAEVNQDYDSSCFDELYV